MKTIPLTQGKVALVDDEDYERLNAFKWYAKKDRYTFYASRMPPNCLGVHDGKQNLILMHREVLRTSGNVDHKNGNGLDNQKDNLRPATNRQNQHNKRKQIGASSSFKGVGWNKRGQRWVARIMLAGVSQFLGGFKVETEAACAYDAAARKYFGEFARLNFPD